MRAFIIKRTGKTWLGNMLFDSSMEFSDGYKCYFDKIFYRKKDAQKYLDTFKYKEYFEVVGVTIDKSKKDNRIAYVNKSF